MLQGALPLMKKVSNYEKVRTITGVINALGVIVIIIFWLMWGRK